MWLMRNVGARRQKVTMHVEKQKRQIEQMLESSASSSDLYNRPETGSCGKNLKT